VTQKGSFKSTTIILLNVGFSLNLAIDKVSTNKSATGVSVDSLSTNYSLFKRAGIVLPRSPVHLALAMHLIVEPLPFVLTCARKGHSSVSHSSPVDPITFVKRAIWPLVGTTPCHLVVVKLSLVNVSLRHFVITDSMASTVVPLTFIASTVWIPYLAVSLTLVVLPVTLVVSAIWPS